MIIYAVNIHVGGGKVLLDELLTGNTLGRVSTLFHDARFPIPPMSHKIKTISIKPTLFSRWKAEYKLKHHAHRNPAEEVLCFGNLPPLFRLKNKVIVYLQTTFLVPRTPLPALKKTTQARLLYERLWFFLFKKNASEFWVQTNFMYKKMDRAGLAEKTRVRPFLPSLPQITRSTSPRYDFICVTSAHTHKRTDDFLNALKRLSVREIQISTLLITDRLTEVQNQIFDDLKNTSIRISLELQAPRERVFAAYCDSYTLVNTSENESFCLPLYEASHFGLQILTCDEPYALEAAPMAKTYKTGDVDQLSEQLAQLKNR